MAGLNDDRWHCVRLAIGYRSNQFPLDAVRLKIIKPEDKLKRQDNLNSLGRQASLLFQANSRTPTTACAGELHNVKCLKLRRSADTATITSSAH